MKNFNPNLYDILGRISKHATDAEIKEAYRTLAKHYHPDKNPDDKVGAEEKMKTLNEAYAILKDPKKRAEYNENLFEHHESIRKAEEERKKRERAEAERKRKAREEVFSKKIKLDVKDFKKKEPVNDGAGLVGAILAIVALGLLFSALSDNE